MAPQSATTMTRLATIACTLTALLLALGRPTSGQMSETEEGRAATKMPIPRCMNIVLRDDEYTLSGDGRLHLSGQPGAVIQPGHFDISATDGSASTCYPLSEQLRNCPRQVTLRRFQLLPNRTITDTLLDGQWSLGHFYLTDKGKAVVCNSGDDATNRAMSSSPTDGAATRLSSNSGNGGGGAGPRLRRACSYLSLSPSEYRVDPSDNRLWIVPANRSVADAGFTIDPLTLSANVCVPLSANLLNCTVWVLERNELALLSNKSLRSLPHQLNYELGDYVLLGQGRAAVCAIEEAIGQEPDMEVERLHAAVNIVSAIFLAASIAVHLLLPQLSYQRAPILCHAFSFMITYLCLASRRLEPPLETPANCYLLFYVTYYFVVASFAWLSVLALDVWRITVHLSTGTAGYRWVTSFADRKFWTYAAFGWGAPALLCALVTLVDRHEGVQDSLLLYPRIDMMCWFNDKSSSMAFLYGPMCVMLLFNFAVFALSVRNLQRANNQVEFTNKKLNKQLLIICFVVFLAMGLFWIMELVSFFTNTYGIHWIVPDLINGSQGVIIALVYTCRPLTWRLLREKFTGNNAVKQ